MQLRCAVAAVLVTGCAATPPHRAPIAGATPATPAPAPASGDLVADLDGDGVDERVVLEGRALWIEHEGARAAFERRAASTITIVDLDPTSPGREILLRETVDESEDPPDRIGLYLWRGGRIVRAFDAVIGTYGTPALSFPGDGTMRYQEDAWTACTRAGNPPSVPLDRVTLALDADGRLVEVGRAPVSAFDCGHLAG
jgi:hypothetical protein